MKEGMPAKEKGRHVTQSADMSKEAGKLRPSAIVMRNNLRKALLKRFMIKQEELKKEKERKSMPVRIV